MIFKTLLKLSGGYNKLRKRYLNSNKFLKKYYKFLLKGIQHEYGAYLPFNNSIEGGINFPHGLYGVFISGGATIGENCTIFQHVTIGSNAIYNSKGYGSPTIGKNCFIGAGAKIIGKVTIGNNCRIGANCVVSCDVPDNCVVVLEKPIIIQKNDLLNRNYSLSKNGFGYSFNGEFILENDPEILKFLHKND